MTCMYAFSQDNSRRPAPIEPHRAGNRAQHGTAGGPGLLQSSSVHPPTSKGAATVGAPAFSLCDLCGEEHVMVTCE